MADALTPPVLVAALVLGFAGLAKLRSPATTARALRTIGLPGRELMVRAYALMELAVFAWSVAAPGAAATVTLGAFYLLLAALTLMLAGRGSECGCFGEQGSPASAGGALLSGAFGILALVGASAPPHGLAWVFERSAIESIVLGSGIAGAACCAVLAYRELPKLWLSWSAG